MTYDHPISAEVLSAKLDNVASHVADIRSQLDDVGKALVTLTRLEERHEQISSSLNRAFGKLEAQEKRLATVEKHVPTLLETRKWVLAGISVTLLAVVGALTKTVVYDPAALRSEIAHEIARSVK